MTSHSKSMNINWSTLNNESWRHWSRIRGGVAWCIWNMLYIEGNIPSPVAPRSDGVPTHSQISRAYNERRRYLLLVVLRSILASFTLLTTMKVLVWKEIYRRYTLSFTHFHADSVWKIKAPVTQAPQDPMALTPICFWYFKPNPAVEALISQQFLLYSPSLYGMRSMKTAETKNFG